MTSYIGKLLDWVKLSPKKLAAIFIFSGLVLFAPEKWLDVLGLVVLRNNARFLFGFAFGLSGAVLLVEAGAFAWGIVNRKWTTAAILRRGLRRLHDLSKPKKEILRNYIEGGTRTQKFCLSDGVAAGLMAEGILAWLTSMSSSYDYFAYNIQPWAWEYLNKNRKLLS
jgi:hypothetical protein